MLTLCHWAELVAEKALDRVMHISEIYRLFIKETNIGLNNICSSFCNLGFIEKEKEESGPTYIQSKLTCK